MPWNCNWHLQSYIALVVTIIFAILQPRLVGGSYELGEADSGVDMSSSFLVPSSNGGSEGHENSDVIHDFIPESGQTFDCTRHADQLSRLRILTALRRQAPEPPEEIPADLVGVFTRCGTIPTRDLFVDDSKGGKGSHYKYKLRDLEYHLESSQRLVRDHKLIHRLGKDQHAAEALLDLDLKGKSVVVFGAVTPRWEMLCLALGAARVTTLEYNSLTYEHPQLETLRLEDLFENPLPYTARFDVGLSISSFDHDGLGRYNDPLGPDADIVAMDRARGLLKPNGTLILTVPIGPDVVVWNLHRRYGPIRLPLMLAGWEEEKRVGWSDDRAEAAVSITKTYEPAIVLRNTWPLQPGTLAYQRAFDPLGSDSFGEPSSNSEEL